MNEVSDRRYLLNTNIISVVVKQPDHPLAMLHDHPSPDVWHHVRGYRW